LPPIDPPVIPTEPATLPEPFFDFEKDGLSGLFDEKNKDWTIFADVGGGSMRYKTGGNSHVNTTNQNIDLGMARNVSNLAN
jgi:hypothetical protein